jgi:hypothetical protein
MESHTFICSTPRNRTSPFFPPSPFPILQSSALTLKDQQIAALHEQIRTRDQRIAEFEIQISSLSQKMEQLEMDLAAKSLPSAPPVPFAQALVIPHIPIGESVDLTNTPLPKTSPVKMFKTSPLKVSLRLTGLASLLVNRSPIKAALTSRRPGTESIRASSLVRKTPRLVYPEKAKESVKPLTPLSYKADANDSIDVAMAEAFALAGTEEMKLLKVNKGFYRLVKGENEREFEAEIVNGVLMARMRGWNWDKRGRVVKLLKDEKAL